MNEVLGSIFSTTKKERREGEREGRREEGRKEGKKANFARMLCTEFQPKSCCMQCTLFLGSFTSDRSSPVHGKSQLY
jgi:hypothetical protein